MSGRRRRVPKTTTPLLGEESRSPSLSPHSSRLHSVFLEMSSSSPVRPANSRRCVFLGVDVGTGSARAGPLISYILRIRLFEFVLLSSGLVSEVGLNLVFNFFFFSNDEVGHLICWWCAFKIRNCHCCC